MQIQVMGRGMDIACIVHLSTTYSIDSQILIKAKI